MGAHVSQEGGSPQTGAAHHSVDAVEDLKEGGREGRREGSMEGPINQERRQRLHLPSLPPSLPPSLFNRRTSASRGPPQRTPVSRFEYLPYWGETEEGREGGGGRGRRRVGRKVCDRYDGRRKKDGKKGGREGGSLPRRSWPCLPRPQAGQPSGRGES